MKIIDGEKYYKASEVGMLIGRSHLTINNYAKWSDEVEEKGEKRFLPKPLLLGTYRYWNEKDIRKIKRFFKSVEENKGSMAEFTRRVNKPKKVLENV